MDKKNPLGLSWDRVASLVLAGCALFLLGACRFGESARPRGEAVRVVMELIAFKPEIVKVSPSTTVTWANKDAAVHTVTSGAVGQEAAGVTERPDGKFDSGEMATGKTFSFAFKEAGTYTYFCSLHPATMRGEVRVE